MAFNAISYKWKRYLFLVLGLSLGFALILLLTGLAGAMKQNVTEAAARHYGGDLFILGHQKSPYYTPVIRDHAALLAAVKEAGIDASLDRTADELLRERPGLLQRVLVPAEDGNGH